MGLLLTKLRFSQRAMVTPRRGNREGRDAVLPLLSVSLRLRLTVASRSRVQVS